MKEQARTGRVNGGNGWADSIFRAQADSKSYAKKLIQHVIRKCNLESESYDTYLADTELVLLKEQEIVVKMSYDRVEALRSEGVHAFESEIENLLTSSNMK